MKEHENQALFIVLLFLVLHTLDVELTTLAIARCEYNGGNMCYLIEQNYYILKTIENKFIFYPFIEISAILILLYALVKYWKHEIVRLIGVILVAVQMLVVITNFYVFIKMP